MGVHNRILRLRNRTTARGTSCSPVNGVGRSAVDKKIMRPIWCATSIISVSRSCLSVFCTYSTLRDWLALRFVKNLPMLLKQVECYNDKSSQTKNSHAATKLWEEIWIHQHTKGEYQLGMDMSTLLNGCNALAFTSRESKLVSRILNPRVVNCSRKKKQSLKVSAKGLSPKWSCHWESLRRSRSVTVPNKARNQKKIPATCTGLAPRCVRWRSLLHAVSACQDSLRGIDSK